MINPLYGTSKAILALQFGHFRVGHPEAGHPEAMPARLRRVVLCFIASYTGDLNRTLVLVNRRRVRYDAGAEDTNA